ncbi:SBBP repeat-containing protein [Leptospira kmetyi]|uniref:SBBP repeat-containing protein n=1 Tax=Leptospira kmetyi TaxID=408139 RepID=UPI0010840820|nr:SBBP repeat-containing protein [Leptospira kmetyi]TGK23130.1 hypothetical protein EHO62_00485 [Leptospira kmetyi]
MRFIQQFITNGILCSLIFSSVNFCKHDKKNSDQDLFFLLQVLAGYSPPGPNPEWVRLSGASGVQTISSSITSDQNSNVYATGYTTGNFDNRIITGIQDLFVTKFNSNGVKQWTTLLGVALDITSSSGITSDPSGNIYTVGNTNGSLDGEAFIGTPDIAFRNLFVVKYDSNGNKQWTRLLGVAGNSSIATAVTTDSSNNIYVSGTSYSGLDGQTFSGGGIGYFIIKYNASGTKLWTKLFSGPKPLAIFYDNVNGKLYITGEIFGNTSLDGIAVTGSSDSFLMQFDSNGNKTWTKLLGVPGKRTSSNSLTSDTSGNIFVTGLTAGSIDGQQKSGGFYDLLIVKYDPNGNRIWTRLLGVTGDFFSVTNKDGVGTGISVSKDSNLFVSGYTTGNFDGQSHKDLNGGLKNLFLTKYDLDGNKKWTSLLGLKGFSMEINGLTTDASGHPYSTGITTGPLNGETYVGTPKTGSNLFIVKY